MEIKKPTLKLIGCLLILFSFSFVGFVPRQFVSSARAQEQAVVQDFGGPIVFEMVCHVPPGLWIITGPPRPASIMVLTPGSIIHTYYTFFYGNYILGRAAATGQVPCQIYVGVSLVEVGEGAPVIMVGTGI